jgi:7-carboxy-7-deazaguanine synthase
MKVNEVFKSIQGESSFTGIPFVFVRFTGCNLRCTYCDTTYAYEEGLEIGKEELIKKIDSYGLKSVEITGGEPLLQEEVHSLVDTLIKKNYRVLVDTNGTRDISTLNDKVIRIMDIKCPGSGETDEMMWKNIDNLRDKDEVKFVIMDLNDYEWAKNITSKYSITEKVLVNFSPAHGFLKPQKLAEWILKDNLEVRFNLQLHKYIWPGVQRGV